MAKLSVKEIQFLAKKIVAESPGGIRYSALVQRIFMENPETPRNTIHGSVWDLATRFPNEYRSQAAACFCPPLRRVETSSSRRPECSRTRSRRISSTSLSPIG